MLEEEVHPSGGLGALPLLLLGFPGLKLPLRKSDLG